MSRTAQEVLDEVSRLWRERRRLEAGTILHLYFAQLFQHEDFRGARRMLNFLDPLQFDEVLFNIVLVTTGPYREELGAARATFYLRALMALERWKRSRREIEAFRVRARRCA